MPSNSCFIHYHNASVWHLTEFSMSRCQEWTCEAKFSNFPSKIPNFFSFHITVPAILILLALCWVIVSHYYSNWYRYYYGNWCRYYYGNWTNGSDFIRCNISGQSVLKIWEINQVQRLCTLHDYMLLWFVIRIQWQSKQGKQGKLMRDGGNDNMNRWPTGEKTKSRAIRIKYCI